MQFHNLFIHVISLQLVYGIGDFDYYDAFDSGGDAYRGKYIGDLSTFHHQVSGSVYAVDRFTLLLKDFTYNGNGKDTFFMVGNTNQPGRKGDIVPNEYGRTNVLQRYLNSEFTLTLPNGKQVDQIKWFAVYDLTEYEAYGALYVPDGFEPPWKQVLSHLEGKSNGVEADQVEVLDSKTLMLKEFYYDGKGGKGIHFYVGRGPQPSSKGTVVPNELGYMEPLRKYHKEDIKLQLPGTTTIKDVRWISVYDIDYQKDLGHVIIPDGINVPPSLSTVEELDTEFPHCQMLHSNLAVAWNLNGGNSLTVELIANIDVTDYVAFGFSKKGASKMVGSDVAIAYKDGLLGYIDDYNITAKSPCSGILGVKKGVCLDGEAHTGGSNNNQIQSYSRENGVFRITFRKTLTNLADAGDLSLDENGVNSIVWAMGRLARPGGRKGKKEPSFHHTYPKEHVQLDLRGNVPDIYKCRPFVQKAPPVMIMSRKTGHDRPTSLKTWGPHRHLDYSLRTFDARLGPPGGSKGYSGITGMPSNGFVWYINGYVASELYMRRGLTYAFRVEGGDDPYNPDFYNPLVISTDPVGGYERLSKEKDSRIRVLAGLEYTRRGVPRPTASGRLCTWTHPDTADRRLDYSFETFERFRNSLRLECAKEGTAAVLTVTPNITWPDVVYYNSYTHPYMGWRINIVDDFNQRFNYGNGGLKMTATGGLFLIITNLVLVYISYL